MLWTKLSNVFFPPKSFSALHRSAAVVIWALPEQEVELPLAWKVPSPRECPGDSPALAVYLKRLHSEQDVQIEFEAEKGMDGNGTAANDGTPVHSSKVSLNRRCKIWARPSSGEWQMYVFRHRTIPSALQHFFPTPLRNMSQLCQCVYLPMRSFDLFKCT